VWRRVYISQTHLPFWKNEINPPSLIFRTLPNREAAIAAVCATTFNILRVQISYFLVSENGPKREEIGIPVQHNSAINSSDRLQNCDRDVEHPFLTQ
jgi:hypothetical protein